MAEEGRISRFLSGLRRPFRSRESPTPTMPLWSSGIQEPVMAQGITIPALYAVSNESLILRTVLGKGKRAQGSLRLPLLSSLSSFK